MTPLQTDLVRRSHARVLPVADRVAERFYARLFELAPALRPLFIGDLRRQGVKLMAMLDAALRVLERPEALLPLLAPLGTRHAGYGVQARDYRAFGVALLGALEDCLGEAFDAPTRESWAALHALISRTMLEAAGMCPTGPGALDLIGRPER